MESPFDNVAAPAPILSPRVATISRVMPRAGSADDRRGASPRRPRESATRRRGSRRYGDGSRFADTLRNLGRGITATHVAESYLVDVEAEVARIRVLVVHAQVFVGRPAELAPLEAQVAAAHRLALSHAEAAVFQRHALLGRRQPCMRVVADDVEHGLTFCDASAQGLALEGLSLREPESARRRVDGALDRLREGAARARQQRVELAELALEIVGGQPLSGALAWVEEAAQRAMTEATRAVASSHRQRPSLALQLLAG